MDKQEGSLYDLLNRALYDNVEEVLPNLEIRTINGKKCSYYNLDGTEHSGRTCKTIINESGVIHNYSHTEQDTSIVSYYARQRNKRPQDVVVELSKQCGIELSPELLERCNREAKEQDIRKQAQSIMAEALTPDTPEYLYMCSRGWTAEEMHSVGIGRISPEVLQRIRAIDKEGLLTKALSDTRVGDIYTLSIPCIAYSSIDSWNLRATDATLQGPQAQGLSKYIRTYGDKKARLCGISNPPKGMDTLFIVEGDLDALHAVAKKITGIVGAMGKSVTEEQIRDAMRVGYKKFIVVYDNDKAGQDAVATSMEIIHKCGGRAYASTLPDEYKDADEYLAHHTAKELGQVLRANEVKLCQILMRKTTDKLRGLKATYGDNVPQDATDDIIQEYCGIARKTPPEDIELLKVEAHRVANNLKVGGDAITSIIDAEVASQVRASNAKDITATNKKIDALLAESKVRDAEKEAKKLAERLTATANVVDFAKDYRTQTEDELRAEMNETPNGAETGIVFGNGEYENPFCLLEGLSFVCGATAHGKTTFLLNVAINEAYRNIQAGNGKQVVFYTYEVCRRDIIVKAHKIWVASDTTHTPEEFDELFILSGALVIVYRNYKVGTLIANLKYGQSIRPISLCVIDYIQSIYSENYNRQRTEEMKDVVNQLKDYAVTAHLPMFAGAQFNRQIASLLDITTANIGEAGDIERIAVNVIGIFNMRLYNPLIVKEVERKLVESMEIFTQNPDYTHIAKNLQKVEGAIAEGQKVTGGQYTDKNRKPTNYLYVRLMKSRYGYFPLDIFLEIHDKSGYIEVNRPERLKVTAVPQPTKETEDAPNEDYGSTDTSADYYDNPEEMDDFII